MSWFRKAGRKSLDLPLLSGWAFQDAEGASIAGLAHAASEYPSREVAGVVIACGDSFYRYKLLAVGRRSSVRFTVTAEAVAFFHTHPRVIFSENGHSKSDIRIAGRLQIPSYVMELRDESVWRYTPADRSEVRILP